MKEQFKLLNALLLLTLLISTSSVKAQLSAPKVEGIFGGRVNAITGYAKNADTSRIFISVESANSIFYTDVYATGTPPVFGQFTVMPGVNATTGYGANIKLIAVHAASGKLFFGHNSGLLSTNTTSATVNTVFSGMISGLLIKGDYLFFTETDKLHFGTLNSSGAFSESSSSPITVGSFSFSNLIIVNPVNDSLYIFGAGTSPKLYRINAIYSALSSSTTISDISPTTLSASVNWTAFNIAPDGIFYFFGSDNNDKYYAFSTNGGISWTENPTGMHGSSANNIDFAGDSAKYSLYTSSVFNDNNGAVSAWKPLGYNSTETHPNDGAVFVDPLNSSIVYLTTDQGIGVSVNGGADVFEIDDGVEAVQVNDFSMTSSKTRAWAASKSGLRRVDNYLSSPLWTNAIFPLGDGNPYQSIEMSRADSNIVYAANNRIYKSTDNGATWNMVFTPENPPYNYPHIENYAFALEECYLDPDIVMAGYQMQDPAHKGGLFVSMDAGASWSQILIKATSVGEDVDVSDIVFNEEKGDTVAYVSVLYELSSPSGYSVYRLVKKGSSWSVSEDMSSSNTSTGSVIVVTINDLEISSTRDTIFAAGTDAGFNHPAVYFKPLNTTNKWTPFTVTGLPTGNKEAKAITLGHDTIYCAVNEEIFYYDLKGGSSWQLGYSYPVGTKINFLYFDDLLVGTSYGLFGHSRLNATGVKDYNITKPTYFNLQQNYPNPFNPSTTIRFSLVKTSFVRLEIFNELGQLVKTTVNEILKPGSYETTLNFSNFASGVYFYRLNTGGKISKLKKMILLK